MAALTRSKRFFSAEINKILFATEIADISNVTRAELDAATDVTDEVADLSGWDVTSGSIDTPDAGHRFVSKIPGRTSTSDSSITFWASQDGDDVRALLPRGTEGYVLFLDGGDVPTQPMDVFPAEVNALGKVRSVAEQGFQLTVGFTITSPPAEDVAIPAAAVGP